jgi:hypothetical protein
MLSSNTIPLQRKTKNMNLSFAYMTNLAALLHIIIIRVVVGTSVR